MNVLGIDQSLTCTGLVVLNDKGEALLMKRLKKEPSNPPVKRMIEIADAIIAAVNEYNIERAAIEGFGFGARGNAIFDLGGLGYIIRAAMYTGDIPLIVVPPTTLKKFVTGKGNCKKDLMLLKVYQRWGVECPDDNVADAFGLAQYLLAYLKDTKNETSDHSLL